MIIEVPVNTIGGLLNDIKNVIPNMEPGIIYGNIDTISIILVKIFFLLVVM